MSGKPSHITLLAPAKLNLRLKVVGRRPDGYHNLVSLMVPVALFDRLRLQSGPRGRIRLKCSGRTVPENPDNLAYQAAMAFFSRTGLEAKISLDLQKRIPVAAGLGGGSSDAAATLLGLNRLSENPLTPGDLADLALGLGADVPFFLQARPCLARGIGEILEPIEKWPKFWYVIVRPPLQISTSWVYSNLRLELTTGRRDPIISVSGHDSPDVAELLENDLEMVTASRFPIIRDIKESLLDAGAEGALMSGSGPSVFGVFRSRDRALSAERDLLSRNWGDTYVVEGITRHDWGAAESSETGLGGPQRES